MKGINLGIIAIVIVAGLLLFMGMRVVGKIQYGSEFIQKNIISERDPLYESCLNFLVNPYSKTNIEKSGILEVSKPYSFYDEVKKLKQEISQLSGDSLTEDARDQAMKVAKICAIIKKGKESCERLCESKKTKEACFARYLYVLEKENQWESETEKKAYEIDEEMKEICKWAVNKIIKEGSACFPVQPKVVVCIR